jgi:hypothetical protein
LNIDESQPASQDVASFLSASPSPSQQSDHGLEYNVPLSYYHGPWNGIESDLRIRRKLVLPKVSEHVLTYHQPRNTIGLDSVGATLWSKDTPGPVRVSSTSSRYLNLIYRCARQLTLPDSLVYLSRLLLRLLISTRCTTFAIPLSLQ